MYLLHAAWSAHDTLDVWGECALHTERLPRPKGRAPAGDRPRRHPFALVGQALRDAVDELAPVGGHPRLVETVVTLPSAAHAPRPSPWLPGASAVTEPAVQVTSWRADAVELDGAALLAFLLALADAPPTVTRMDAGLAGLAQVAVAALDLVARGRVLPGLVSRDGRHLARWQPVLDPGDTRRLVKLARGLAPSVMAVPGESHRSPGTVVRELVEVLVDTATRDSLGTATLGSTSRPGRRATVEQVWLGALTGTDARVHADPDALADLAGHVQTWHRSGVTAGGLRTAFRLRPPRDLGTGAASDVGPDDADESAPRDRDAEQDWELEFLLQADDDPSLLVPAEQVWAAGPTLQFLERTLEQPQERLLADLGRASRLWPDLEDSLATAAPTGHWLATDDVVEFLREVAPVLEHSGFGLLLPAELRRPARLGARLKTTSSSPDEAAVPSGLLGHDGIVDYQWQVAVGDDPVTADELAELARLKSPLVAFRGRWVAVTEDDLQTAIALLETPPGQMAVAEAARIGLGVSDPDLGLPVTGIDADGPLGALLSSDGDTTIEAVTTPAGFVGTLRPYQARGVAWLAFLARVGLGGCLADDMGLGKTPQLLALLVHERDGRARWAGPTLLICPMSIVGNWEREAARFTPELTVAVHHGSTRASGDEAVETLGAADLVLTTYGTAARDREVLAEVAWQRIALDEAQHIKNPQAKQSRAIRSLPAPQRVALTGTPVENRLGELWSIMDFCNPGLLGERASFRARFTIPIERLGDDEAAASLRRVTRPFLLRRLKTDRALVGDLPDKLEYDEHCNLTREQASLYRAVVDDMLAKVETSEGIERRGLVLTTMLRLKQVCNHPAHLLADGSALPRRSGKLDRLEELVDEIAAAGERLLVFTQFAQWGRSLATHLRQRSGRDVAFLHGGASKTARDHMVEAFQSGTGPGVFVLSLKAGGVGLNLTAANHVVHYDRWWNPAVEDQATDRAFRIGQRRDVLVRRFVCVGTLEERIAELIRRKRELAERVVGTGESWLTELSTDELRDVITLGAEAVAV